jgi:hypothetical protein
MVDGGILDHRQFIKELVILCRRKSSGTVFYNLESGLSARMVLNHGEICWIAFADLRGMDAINEIRSIERGRMSFNSSLKLTIGTQNLPTTPEILKEVNTRDSSHRSKTSNQKATDSSSVSTESFSGHSFNKDEVCETVVKESIEFIGPIAKLICADYMKSMPEQISARDVRKLLDSIVTDINDEVKRRVFKDRVRNLLKIE